MELTAEFYENLKPEQLEENIEFVDWLCVPKHLLTDELVDKFSSFLEIGAIIWFMKWIDSVDIKFDYDVYQETIFLFSNKKLAIVYDKQKNDLYCLEEPVWYILRMKFKLDHARIIKYLKTFVNKKLNIDISCVFHITEPYTTPAEKHFYPNIEETKI